ncbi:MAG: hypothetical protein ACI4E2_11705 [Acetatifactor sp.]
MKKLIRVTASQEIDDSQSLQFSVEDIMWLLQNIEDLKKYKVDFRLMEDAVAEFIVGEYAYTIPTK